MFSPTLAGEEIDGEVELIVLVVLEVIKNRRLFLGPLECSTLSVGVASLVLILCVAANPREEDVSLSLRAPDLGEHSQLSLRIQQGHRTPYLGLHLWWGSDSSASSQGE